ncbi:MAG: glycosyltransferase [Candidatus Parvarchaeota archaeon]
MAGTLTLVYPDLKVPSGYKTYQETVVKGLSDAKYPFKQIAIKKIEFSFRGKPIGGLISQELYAMLHSYPTRPIHALSPEVSTHKTDIVTIHDVVPLLSSTNSIGKRYYSRIFRNALEAKTLITPSNTAKNDLIKLGIRDEKINVIYSGIDTSQFFYDPPSGDIEDGKKILVTVGDYNPRKRFDLLYNIISKMDDVVLYHVGPQNSWGERYQYLRNLASQSKNIRIVGEVPRETLRNFYSIADLFVYISDAEGFGLPPLEAMACGTNVVVNDIPIFRETLGEAGFISNIENFEEKIHYALDHKKSRATLQEHANKFSVQREIEELLKIYQKYSRKPTA